MFIQDMHESPAMFSVSTGGVFVCNPQCPAVLCKYRTPLSRVLLNLVTLPPPAHQPSPFYHHQRSAVIGGSKYEVRPPFYELFFRACILAPVG